MTVLEKIKNDFYISYSENMEKVFDMFQKDLFFEVSEYLQNKKNINNKAMNVYLRCLFLGVIDSTYLIMPDDKKDNLESFLLNVHTLFMNMVESIKVVELLIMKKSTKDMGIQISSFEQKYYS